MSDSLCNGFNHVPYTGIQGPYFCISSSFDVFPTERILLLELSVGVTLAERLFLEMSQFNFVFSRESICAIKHLASGQEKDTLPYLLITTGMMWI